MAPRRQGPRSEGRRQCLHVPKRLSNRRDPWGGEVDEEKQSDREAEFRSVGGRTF